MLNYLFSAALAICCFAGSIFCNVFLKNYLLGVPLLGVSALIIIYYGVILAFVRGTRGDNCFGPDPVENESDMSNTDNMQNANPGAEKELVGRENNPAGNGESVCMIQANSNLIENDREKKMENEKNNVTVAQNITGATAPAEIDVKVDDIMENCVSAGNAADDKVIDPDVKALLSLSEEEVVKSGKRAGILTGWGVFQLISSCLAMIIGGFFGFTENAPWAWLVLVCGTANILPAIVCIYCRSEIARIFCALHSLSMIVFGVAGFIINAQHGMTTGYIMPVVYGCFVLGTVGDEKLWGESHFTYKQLAEYGKMLKKNNVVIDKIPAAFRLDEQKDKIISIIAIISWLVSLAAGFMLSVADFSL